MRLVQRLADVVRIVLADTLADLEGIAGEIRIQAESMRAEGGTNPALDRAGRLDPAGPGAYPPGHVGRVGEGVEVPATLAGARRPS